MVRHNSSDRDFPVALLFLCRRIISLAQTYYQPDSKSDTVQQQHDQDDGEADQSIPRAATGSTPRPFLAIAHFLRAVKQRTESKTYVGTG